MAESSFDIEASVDLQEVDNAINQARKEVASRFDFKGTDTEITWQDDKAGIRLVSSSEDRVKAALDVLESKLVKRHVSLKALDTGAPEAAAGGRSRIDVALRTGLSAELGKEIVKQIKATKIKVTPTNMGDRIRVSGKKRDDLQEIIAMVKAQDYDAPLAFTNFKS